LVCVGLAGIMNHEAKPIPRVNKPSMRNSHCRVSAVDRRATHTPAIAALMPVELQNRHG